MHARIVVARRGAHPPSARESPRDVDPIDAVPLSDPADQLELDQRRGHIAGSNGERSRELVDARGLLRDLLEHRSGEPFEGRDGLDCGLDPVLPPSTSAAAVTGVAPSRRSAFEPAETAEVISPGTTNTSRPSSSAKSAVIRAPERSRASTTTVAVQRPAMIRFRAGKRHGAGSSRPRTPTRSGRSPRSAPQAHGWRPDSPDRYRSRERQPSRRPRRALPCGPRCRCPRHPADDDEPCGPASSRPRARATGPSGERRAGSRADNGDRSPGEQFGIGVPAEPEHPRWIRDGPEERWVRRKPASEAADGHADATPTGERYDSASATCSGSTDSAPASAAMVRATRATRARPRPERGTRSTARSSNADAASVRRRRSPSRSRARPATTRP